LLKIKSFLNFDRGYFYTINKGYKMKNLFFVLVFIHSIKILAQTTANDGDWSKQLETLKSTPEADYMIRIGDIDNLGYGWPENFDPFSGRSTDFHEWPFRILPEDAKGTDRVMISSSFAKNQERQPCLGDGYSTSDVNMFKVVPLEMPLASIKDANINSAALLMFVDDFQSPSMCSRFRVWFNGKRLTPAEKIFDGIDQSGPVGKIIYIKIPGEMLPLLKKDKLVISIDDSTTYAGDGYAIDFVKLLINPKPYKYLGPLKVYVRNTANQEPIKNAVVSVPEFGEVKTNSDGRAKINGLYAGLVIADFSAKGFISKTQSFDVIAGEEENEYEVWLDPLENVKVEIEGKELMEGESLVLNNIQFKVASAELLKEGKTELNKVVNLMKQYPKIEIELSGHTSSEGDAKMNKELSLRRVESCRKYLSDNGISEDRISIVGYGPDKPIAPNDTEQNRALNRRVELKITRIQ
jgi:outer membrane protein OmpA-like peptidoglycan-associated protein